MILFLALAATSARAQSTVATFDNPSCSGNGVRTYQGIDFSISPWDCENSALSGQTGTSISWFQRITTGQFRFIFPQALVSLSAATSAGSGTLTISTDAGESFSHSVTTVFKPSNRALETRLGRHRTVSRWLDDPVGQHKSHVSKPGHWDQRQDCLVKEHDNHKVIRDRSSANSGSFWHSWLFAHGPRVLGASLRRKLFVALAFEVLHHLV